MIASVALLSACSYAAFTLSALCGGGAGLILIPVLGGIVPVSQVPAALSIGTFSSSASRIFVFYRHIRWPIVARFVPPALPAVWFGAWLLKFINPVYLEMVMGLFLVLNLPLVFRKSSETYEVRKPSNLFLMFIGFLAGFLSGLTGAVGLLFNRFYLRYGLSNQEIVATRAANEIILHLIKIVLYALFGLATARAISAGLAVALSAVLSTVTVKYILPHLSEFLFKKVGYTAMVLSGVVMLGQSGMDFIRMNRGQLSANIAATGVAAKVQWQNSHYSLEYTYDDDDHTFTFEQVIPITDLSPARQEYVRSRKGMANRIVVEAVYGIDKKSYEAYYYLNGKLMKKIGFAEEPEDERE